MEISYPQRATICQPLARGGAKSLAAAPPDHLSHHDQLSSASEKKADVVERPKVFDHVGLLVNWPPGTAGLPFI